MKFSLIVLAVFVLALSTANAGLKGQENWKQRFQNWRTDEVERGEVIGQDEANAARLDHTDNNNLDPSPEDKKKHYLEEKKRKWEKKYRRYEMGLQDSKLEHHEQRRRDYIKKAQENQGKRLPRHLDSALMTPAPPTVLPNPPPHEKIAEMARYIVHASDWASLAYISYQPGMEGLPFSNIFSISDGFRDNSTGVPYLFVTPFDITVQDLTKDSRCSLTMTLAQGDYCTKKNLDPEDPRCARVILTGKIKSLKNGSHEWSFAEKVFFDRHPSLRDAPKDHKFRLVKMKISHITVLDYFGGVKSPSVSEYFKAKPNALKESSEINPDAEILPGASVSTMENVPVP